MRRVEQPSEFDWWLLEHVEENDPVSMGALVYEIEAERAFIADRLGVLRERGFVNFKFSSRPTQWSITEDGRACLASGIRTS